MNRKSTPIPEPIAQLQRQLDQFRSTQPGRTRLPESRWQAAIELARQHGVSSVAHPLRLDYTGLKERLGAAPSFRRKTSKPAFVELVGPGPGQPEECVIELESCGGSRMRIQWKTSAPLIHTCQLCGANSFDYLTELQRHAQELAAIPAEWMPWNYRQTLERAGV